MPGANDTIRFGNNAGLSKNMTSGSSVKKIIFADNAPAGYNLNFSAGDYGSTNVNSVNVGSVLGLENIHYYNATTHGTLGASGQIDNLKLWYTGTDSVITADAGSTDYYAKVDFGSSSDRTSVRGNTVLFHGSITGSGRVTNGGTAMFFLNPGDQYAGELDLTSGSLSTQANFQQNTESSILKLSGATLTFTDSGSTDYFGHLVMSGDPSNTFIAITGENGSVTINNPITDANSGSGFTLQSGTFILGGSTASNYAGGTRLYGGTFQGPSTLFPSYGGVTFTDNAILKFTDSASGDYAVYSQDITMDNTSSYVMHSGSGKLKLTGVVTGNQGGIIVDGGGTLYLTNSDNNWRGDTYIRNGSTLEVDNASNLSDSHVQFDINSGNHLIFYSTRTNDSYSGNIDLSSSSASSLIMAGTGKVTLSGFVRGGGGVEVRSGTLDVHDLGAHYGPTTIRSGATLVMRDTGSGGGSYNIDGGTLDLSYYDISSGDTDRWLSQLSVSPGSRLIIPINDAGYSVRTNINGTESIDLSNLTVQIEAAIGTYTEGMEYTLFNNVTGVNFTNQGGITMELNNVSGLTAVLGTINSGDNQVKFMLTRSARPSTIEGRPVAATHAAVQATATNVSAFAIGGTMVVARSNALDGTGTSSSGGGYEDKKGHSFTKKFLSAPDVSKDFLNATHGAMMAESQKNAQVWSPVRTETTGVWVQPFGMIARQVAEGGNVGYKTRTGGLMAGFDHRICSDVILGAGVGYAQTRLNFDSNQGKTSVRDKFLTFFGTWFRGPWYLEASLLMGSEQYRGNRNTGQNSVFAENSHGGYQFTPKIGGGYTFDVDGMKLRTYATFDYAYSAQDGYQETGAGASNLYWKHSTASILRSEAGINLTKVYEFEDCSWKPGVTLSLVSKRPIKKGTITSPSAGSFESTTVTTTDIAPGVESTWQFTGGYSLSASWTAEFGSQYSLQEASVKFTKKL